MGNIDVIEVHGAPRERGIELGRSLGDEIRRFYPEWLAVTVEDLQASERDVLAYAAAHLPATIAYAPDLVEELEGIAEGAGVAFESLFALNCYDELMQHGPEILIEGLHGCTAFAASGRATGDRSPYVGQGWDLPTMYPPCFYRITDAERPDALVFSHPGMLAATGMNEHGLSLCMTTLKASDRGVGVPVPFVVRKALQAVDLQEMVGNVITAQRANGMNLVLADDFQAVNVEMSATKYHVFYCHGVLAHANHFEAPELLQFEMDMPLRHPDTLIRSGRMREVLEERFGEITLRVLQEEILSDHAGGPASICRHPCRGFETSVALIFEPRERRVWATKGNPCERPFEEYGVYSAARGASAPVRSVS